MAFSSGAKAENKAKGTLWQIGLVRMRDDGWIEEGRGFERILMTEIRAKQQGSFFGELRSRAQERPHLLETPLEKVLCAHVPLAELGLDLTPQCLDFALRHSTDLCTNSLRTWVIWTEKRAEQHPGALDMAEEVPYPDRKSTRLNSSHELKSRMPSSA